MPLVVNTMGWNKGLGADLSRKIEEMVDPTHVFSIRAPEFLDHEFGPETPQRHPHARHYAIEGENLDTDMKLTVVELEPVPGGPLTARYSAADWRTISFMSYFHSRLALPRYLFPTSGQVSYSPSSTTHDCTRMWNTVLPLLARPPYAVTPSIAFDGVVLTGPGSEDVVASEIGRVLNGAVVALVRCEPGTADNFPEHAMDGHHPIPYSQGAPPPDPLMSTCLGLALIRATALSLIDTSHPSSESHSRDPQLLQVLTPLPPALLASARVIVKGEVELPIWGMLDFRELEGGRGKEREKERAHVPFLQWSKGEGVGAERKRVRRNLMRRGQM